MEKRKSFFNRVIREIIVFNKALAITAPTRNWRFSASYDSFVVNQTFVLRMNICGKNRQLLVAAKRYAAL
jgi:hypothetical protein